MSMSIEYYRDACKDMFDFLHDVITDIADESEEWFKLFNEEFDAYLAPFEEK